MPNNDKLVAAALAATRKKQASRPKVLSPQEQEAKRQKCAEDIFYFADTYCYIFDKQVEDWARLRLWPSQREAISLVLSSKYVIFMKARQMGWTWCMLVIALWMMVFHPIAKVLLFSQRDEDAAELIERLTGMYDRLPKWLKLTIAKQNEHEFELSNESNATAMPSSAGGRSRAATLVLADEADYMPNLSALVKAARPTINDGAGRLVILSTVNDETPGSYFQRVFKEALKGETEWKAMFFSWRAHPGRDQAWYDRECHNTMTLEGTLDSIWKEYPETVDQALAARSTDKRFPPFWIKYFSREVTQPLRFSSAPILPGLSVYVEAELGHAYGIGVDPAEGMQSSDDSVITVVDAVSKEEVAVLAGKFEPSTVADYAVDLSNYYNHAPILPERNNHGILFLDRIRKAHSEANIKSGEDGKQGWHTSHPSKTRLYTHLADDLMKETIRRVTKDATIELNSDLLPKLIHNPKTITQLASIESGDANKAPAAPDGMNDDYATGFVLAQECVYTPGTSSLQQVPYTGLYPQRDSPTRLPGQPPRNMDSRDSGLSWSDRMRINHGRKD